MAAVFVQLLRGRFGGALKLADSALRLGRHVNPQWGKVQEKSFGDIEAVQKSQW
jgi:hypothetical protein